MRIEEKIGKYLITESTATDIKDAMVELYNDPEGDIGFTNIDSRSKAKKIAKILGSFNKNFRGEVKEGSTWSVWLFFDQQEMVDLKALERACLTCSKIAPESIFVYKGW